MKKDKNKDILTDKQMFELFKAQKGSAYLALSSIVLPVDFPVTSVIWDPRSIAITFLIPGSRAIDYSDSSDWATKDISDFDDTED
jgi:hypothetical protein